MGVTAIVGANWGDEGKGKMIDSLASHSDLVIRFQGGNNAGHTVINDQGRFALHLLPSGVFYPNVLNLLGPGVAVNIKAFLEEYQTLIRQGITKPQLGISNRAQVVLPYHKLFDELEEQRLADRQFGSTKSGIAPFYSDKYLKIGIQVADLFDRESLTEKIGRALEQKNILLANLYQHATLTAKDIIAELDPYIAQIEPFVCDTNQLVQQALRAKKDIILEGQLGALRDPDHGIYPFTTSSSTLAGFATVGAGIPPHAITRIIAVVKAYSSCVGAGPFVTELFDKAGDELRSRGGDKGEYGATTGRPRRMGWFDLVATRYGCHVQGATEIALTLLDVLSYLDEIPVCVQYELDGNQTDYFPSTTRLNKSKPRYKILKGWKQDITQVREFSQLPQAAQDYVKFIEQEIEIPIRWISVGPHRDSLIRR